MNSSYLSRVGTVRPNFVVLNKAGQRGVSLLVALVALVVMTVAGFALLRSVDTGNVIAGNMAFREVTVHAADLGIEAAATYLHSTVNPSPDANLPSGCSVATANANATDLGNCRYTARMQGEYSNGVPRVDWTVEDNIPKTTSNGVSYQYVVERMCNPDTSVDVTLTQAAKNETAKSRCATEVVEGGGSNKPSGYGSKPVSKIVAVKYRVTVRVTGPRNTISTIQAVLER